jgi:bacterioferritin-associated ferredoxin
MVVCLCNGVTEAAIHRAARSGIRTLSELAMSTGCTAGCGCCLEAAELTLREALSEESQPSRAACTEGLLVLV